jgi:hypothetical protein
MLATRNRKARRPEEPGTYVEVLRRPEDELVRVEASPLVIR